MSEKEIQKVTVTERKNGSRRVQLHCGESMTDPSFKQMCDINNIISQYQKTGQLPHFKEKIPQYVNIPSIPSFMEAFDLVQSAVELFDELPAEVRKAMDNDPANLEEFVTDEKNQELLIKHGLMTKKEKAPEEPKPPAKGKEEPPKGGDK